MSAIIAQGLGKRFRRRHIPAAPTLKERMVNAFRRRGGGRDEYHWALREVSLEVAPGEMVGVIGANGSGKSTLLKLLAGIYRPDEGTIQRRGKVTSLIELGAGFHPDLSGRENILINGLLLGLSRAQVRERLDGIISFSGLGPFIDNPVRGYSSGMYMRLGFAIAAHVDPDILLIDEILAVGDEAFQHRCLGTIAEFQGRGGTIVYISHDLGAVRKHCRRVVWLDGGRVRHSGGPEEVIDAYLELVEAQQGARLMAEHHRLEIEKLGDRGKRWGGGEITITGVNLRDRDGTERYLFQTGDDIVIDIGYAARVSMTDVVFGVAVHREDGVACYGTNTLIDGCDLGRLSGPGRVQLSLAKVPLLTGVYYLDVAVHRADGYPYDYHSRAYRLEMRGRAEDLGVCRLNHVWSRPPA